MKQKKRKAILATFLSLSSSDSKKVTASINTCKACECNNCGLTFASNLKNPFCSDCGAKASISESDQDFENLSELETNDEDAVSSVDCAACKSANILSTAQAESFAGFMHCASCGEEIVYAMDEEDLPSSEEEDIGGTDLNLEGDDELNDDLDTELDTDLANDDLDGEGDDLANDDLDGEGDEEVLSSVQSKREKAKKLASKRKTIGELESESASDEDEVEPLDLEDEANLEPEDDVDLDIDEEDASRLSNGSRKSSSKPKRTTSKRSKRTLGDLESDNDDEVEPLDIEGEDDPEEAKNRPMRAKAKKLASSKRKTFAEDDINDDDAEPLEPEDDVDLDIDEEAEVYETEDDVDLDIDEDDVEESTQISATIASLISSDEISCAIRASQGNESTIFIMTNNIPVASLQLSSELFTTDKYLSSINQMLAFSGYDNTVEEYEFDEFTVPVDDTAVYKSKLEDLKSESEDELEAQIASMKKNVKKVLAIAANGLNRNFFSKKSHALKEAMCRKLTTAGMKRPQSLVDQAFAEASDAYTEMLISTAMELYNKSPEVLAELESVVASSTHAMTSDSDLDVELDDPADLHDSLEDDDVGIEQSTASMQSRLSGSNLRPIHNETTAQTNSYVRGSLFTPR